MPTGEPIQTAEEAPADFIREIVARDAAAGLPGGVVTRFPPEPNGYLHIGHAKSICLNFGIAREFGGTCNLRLDDTNPAKEETEYVDAILADVRWLLGGWADHCLGMKPAGGLPEERDGGDVFAPRAEAGAKEPFFASDYFGPLYRFAERLIEKGKAYVCDLTAEETDRFRGAPNEPGTESPFRSRTPEENLALFRRMRAGEFPDGARTLRAKIDMASPNVWLRDPVLYRIRHATHHHTGDAWCIYPLYDFAHCLSDYIEGITHSICTLEFEVHRPLYDWILESLDLPRRLPRQFEFARLNLSYTVLSKRKLLQLVNEGLVTGWDDPRMPTLSGLRRRGVTAAGLRNFAYRIGITKYDGTTDIAVFEHAVREDLNRVAWRKMGVLRPLKVVITNYPEGPGEEVDATNNPEQPETGKRKIPFTRELFIDADDFMETPPPKYFRLRPGGEVRLKYAYIIRCEEVVKDAAGTVVELRCVADLGSKTGGPTADRKVKGTIHWVSAPRATDAEVRLYDRLFDAADPDEGGDFRARLNRDSMRLVAAKLEPSLADASPSERYQFERVGYFALDPDTRTGAPVFNRVIGLKDSWAKAAKGPAATPAPPAR
jgi:glutaminyl-tRNA synthetase